MIREPLEGIAKRARTDVAAVADQSNPLTVVEDKRRDAGIRDAAGDPIGVDDGQEIIRGQHGPLHAGNLPHQSRVTSRSRAFFLAGIFPHMARNIRERIQERLVDLSKSARAASLDGGLGADAIRDLMRRPNDSPTMETIQKLADGLGTTAAWLAFEAGPKTLAPRSMGGLVDANRMFTLAPIDGDVKAGAFLRRAAFDDDLGEVISAPRDPDFPYARQRAYRVLGDSMNKAEPRPIRDGDFIICSDWEDLRIEPKDRMLVVVQQLADGGQSRERSVKQLRLYSDRAELAPMSSNPEHETITVPRDLEADDGREVRILALVRYVFDNQVIR